MSIRFEPSPTAAQADVPVHSWRAAMRRRIQEFRIIGQDPLLATGLILVGSFVFLFVALPLMRVGGQAVIDPRTGEWGSGYLSQYLNPFYRAYNLRVIQNTLIMGVGAALGGTILGFIFAYTLVRCNVPWARGVHILALLPTISPPFAIAVASILLFGRNGLVTRQWLGIRPALGVNDIYGLDGIIFVQIITFFPIAYLIIRGMLERIDPSMEEAALSLGAGKFHIFRTVTVPLLVPGIAGSFLLLFVESLADLGNPLILGGNVSVLSTEIFLAISGQFDQQKGAVLSVILLVPTLTVFLLQRYWVSRRSYISVTGKPTGGQAYVKEPLIRWTFITLTFLVLILILGLYLSIFVGSFTVIWGINNTLDFGNYQAAFTRGLAAILSTTFLAAVATPVAGITGIVIAFMVVRKNFWGKQALDFVSNLGGAVPGTVLGIGYIVAFINAPMPAVIAVYLVIGLYLFSRTGMRRWLQVAIFLLATALGYGLNWAPWYLRLDENGWRQMLILGFLLTAVLSWFVAQPGKRKIAAGIFLFMALLLLIYNLSPLLTQPLSIWGRTLPGTFWPRLVTRFSSFISVFTQPTMTMLGFTFLVLGMVAVAQVRRAAQGWVCVALTALASALVFFGNPLALIGTPYLVIAAYAVRSLPTAVRAGVASLHQIDPAIEEASTSLGADSQYTFRHITLPLILPAFIAGLIFAFATHMTSLSAIIFLTTPEWPILTVWILSEVEQGGMSTAAAYSVILIGIVLIAIGLLYLYLNRVYRNRDVDISMGG